MSGAQLFRTHCASCHGENAKGAGPISAQLRNAVPDLTTFSARNGGMFPAERVRQMIEGRGPAAHGDRSMPIWGDVFRRQETDGDAAMRIDVDRDLPPVDPAAVRGVASRGLTLSSEQRFQLRHVDGFHQMIVTARFARSGPVVLLPPSGQRDHFDGVSRHLRANLPCGIVSVETRHADVHENHCRAERTPRRRRLRRRRMTVCTSWPISSSMDAIESAASRLSSTTRMRCRRGHAVEMEAHGL